MPYLDEKQKKALEKTFNVDFGKEVITVNEASNVPKFFEQLTYSVKLVMSCRCGAVKELKSKEVVKDG